MTQLYKLYKTLHNSNTTCFRTKLYQHFTQFYKFHNMVRNSTELLQNSTTLYNTLQHRTTLFCLQNSAKTRLNIKHCTTLYTTLQHFTTFLHNRYTILYHCTTLYKFYKNFHSQHLTQLVKALQNRTNNYTKLDKPYTSLYKQKYQRNYIKTLHNNTQRFKTMHN